MNTGYSKKDIRKFGKIASSNGAKLVLINSAKGLTNYLNSKDASSSKLSENRENDKVESLTIFGHGFINSAEFGYHQTPSEQEKFSWDRDDATKLDDDAFENANICFYTCNAATLKAEGDKSLIQVVAEATKSTVSGYEGRSDYAPINRGEGWGAKINRNINGFNTNGSFGPPVGGTNDATGGQRSRRIVVNGRQ